MSVIRFQAKQGEPDLSETQKARLYNLLIDNEGEWFVIQKVKEINSTRTSSQNNAVHLWLTQVADELDKQGHTLQDVVKAIKRAEIRPTMEALKEVMWKPIQQIMFKKKSTTQLEKLEVDKVYEVANKFLSDNFETHVPFPSQDELARIDPNFIKN